MSDFIKKVQEASAVVEQELTVLEGVDGIDPLAPEDGAETPADDTEAATTDEPGPQA